MYIKNKAVSRSPEITAYMYTHIENVEKTLLLYER